MAKLQTLALYLAAGIEVENPAWGRGRLVGLPYVQPWDRRPDEAYAHVHFDFPAPDEIASGVAEVGKLRPVLYAPGDRVRVVAAHPERARFTAVLALALPELERMATLVDAARALGIALNLSGTDYIRKELPHAA